MCYAFWINNCEVYEAYLCVCLLRSIKHTNLLRGGPYSFALSLNEVTLAERGK